MRRPRQLSWTSPVFLPAYFVGYGMTVVLGVQFLFAITSGDVTPEQAEGPIRQFNAQRAWDESTPPLTSFNDPAHDLGNVLWMAEVAKEAIAKNPTRENLLELKIVEDCLTKATSGPCSQAEFEALKERLRAARSRIIPAERR